MQKKSLENHSLTEGVIWKQLLIYFFPILLGTFFQQLYNTADAVIVGRYAGEAALAAVGGTTGVLINLLVNFFVGLSGGASVIISQFFGREDEDGVSRAVHTAIALSVLSGLLLTVVGIAFSRWALGLMGTPADVIDNAAIYMEIYFAGITFNLLYNMCSGILRAIGDSRRPMIFLILCCLANIGFDLLFVVVFHMGVAGAALGTIISQAISAVLEIITLMRSKGASYQLHLKKIRLDFKLLPSILRIGLPTGLQSEMYNIANLIIQSDINSFGTLTIAAQTAYGKIDCIFWMVISAFGISLLNFVGQNYGARRYDRIRKGMRTCFVMSAATTVIITLAMIGFRRPLLGIFTDNADAIDIGIAMMLIEAPFYVTYVPIEMFSGTMRGMGNSYGPMLMVCVGVCVFRVIWLFTVVAMFKTLTLIMLSYGISWVITSVAMFFYYRHFGKKVGLLA